MRKNIVIAMILSLLFTGVSFAATVGGQADMSIPEESFFLKEKAVEYAMDYYESEVGMKAGFDAEFLIEKKFHTTDDVKDARIEGGRNMNFKFSMNYSNVLEPYVKIGTSDLKVKWKQHSSNIEAETKPGFVLGGGLKAKVWEFTSTGIELTADGQYKDTDLGFDKAEVSEYGPVISVDGGRFDMQEWQISLIASKKLILPMGSQDCYMVPYGGVTYSNSYVNVDLNSDGYYVIDNAKNRKTVGVVIGCDMLPSLVSWYLFSFELRLFNETALSVSGTMKF